MDVTTLAAERVATEAAPNDADGRAHAPTLPTYAVHRTALVNRLRSSGAAVVVVAAPAGYGKTTLIAQWPARDQRRSAWMHIEEGDSSVRLIEAFGRELGVEGLPEELGRSV